MASYYGSYGSPVLEKYLGIWYKVTDNGTTVSVSVEIWYKDVNCSSSNTTVDSSNTLYFNMDATSATTSKGTISINTASVETKIATYSYTYTKGTSAVKHNCAAKWANIGSNDITLSVTNSFTVPALDTYTVSYHANGGEAAPDIQEKISGKWVWLRSEVPIRLGYRFIEWNTASDGSGTTYERGSAYTTDADITLYAIWEAVNCDIYIYKSDLSCKACTFVEGDYVGFDKYGRVLANEFVESSDSILLGNTMQFAELVEK